MSIKKLILTVITLSVISISAFAESIRIYGIEYHIKGMLNTRELEKEIPVDTKKIFENENDFISYVENLKQNYRNTRVFETFTLEYNLTPSENDADCTYFANLNLTGTIGWHFLAMPYFKYSSSEGFIFKLKAKDTNFFGTMQPFDASLDIAIKHDEDINSDKMMLEPSLNIAYNFPFTAGPVKMEWTNDHTLSYTIGNSSPEWELKTGLTASLPLTSFMDINTGVYQDFIRNLEYQKYGDDTYFAERANISFPFHLFTFPDKTHLSVVPMANFTYIWDGNGINSINEDLLSPSVNFGITASVGKINWIGNFRNGYSSSTSIEAIFNFQKQQWSEAVTFKGTLFKAYEYIGFSSRLNAFAVFNGKRNFDSDLRGIRDHIHYNGSEDYLCNVPYAFVANFDMPFHVFTTDWENFPVTRKIKFMKNFNFELQLSPFVDLALVYDPGKTEPFAPKEGLYCGGLEVIIFPAKWTNFQIRASLGVDLGGTYLKDLVDNSRKQDVKKYEISIGLGLMY